MKLHYRQIGNIVLVGTSHIAKESVTNVAGVITTFAPCLVGVELDRYRFYSLLHEPKQHYFPTMQNIRRFGVKGTIFALIASYVSQKLSQHVGAKPGDDMMSAIVTAKKHNLTIVLLDQPIQRTLQRFSAAITWTEKWHFFVDILKGVLFPRRELKKYGLEHIDLRKVPTKNVITKMVHYIQERYPNVYTVLIDERNKYMVAQIRKFQKKYPDMVLVAVIGAGHEEGMQKLLEKHG